MTGENFIYSDWESMCALTVETRIEEIFASFIRILCFLNLVLSTLDIGWKTIRGEYFTKDTLQYLGKYQMYKI